MLKNSSEHTMNCLLHNYMLTTFLKNYSQFSLKTTDGFLLKFFLMATRYLFYTAQANCSLESWNNLTKSANKFEEMGLAHLLIFKASGLFFTASSEEAVFLRFLLALIFY